MLTDGFGARIEQAEIESNITQQFGQIMRKKNGKDNRIEKKGIGKKSVWMGIMSFLLPFVILTIACKFAGAMPFGPKSLLSGEGGSMTLSTMFQARDQILQGEYLYSFSAGGGTNLYYENPILAMLLWLALVPEKMLPPLISFVILVKMALCGLTMYLYLKRSIRHAPLTEQQNEALILSFTTAYALSSYQLSLACDFYQVDIICLLPLLLLTMEQLILYSKPIRYALVLTLELILCREHVISVFLFLVLWLFTYTFENKRDFLKKAFSFTLYSLLAFGMAFWAIYAVVLGNEASAYTGFSDTQLQLPKLYCGYFVIVLLLVSIFITNKQGNYFYRFAMTGAMLALAHCEPGFFVGPTGRYVIFWVFLIVDIAWDVMCEILIRLKKNSAWEKVIRPICYVLMGVTLVELSSNACLIFTGLATERKNADVQTAARWLGEQEPGMSGLDRVAFLGYENANQGRNDHLGSFGIKGGCVTPQQLTLGDFLGMEQKGNAVYDTAVPSPMSAMLGRVRYIITPADTGIDKDPENFPYQLIREEGGARIYENSNLLPEVFFIGSVTMYKMNSASTKEQFVDYLIDSFSGRGVYDEPVTIDSFRGGERDAAIWLSEKSKAAALKAVVVSDGRLLGEIKTDMDGYLCIPIPYEQGWRAVVNNNRAELFQMKNGMMAVRLEKGENVLRLTFIPFGFITGIMVTYLSFLILFLLQVIANPKKKGNTILEKGQIA